MKFRFRPATFLLPLPLVLCLCPTGHAAGLDDAVPTPQTINQLEQRALQASPREQCFLYTELVHSMTELAGKQMMDGDIGPASATLKRVEHYARLIHLGLARDNKRLKNAELIMHHTTRRLVDYMHAASGDDRVVLQATLKELDQVQDEILSQVFAR
ncbi:hypothetical protein [Granulicella sp. dw_53]|uniref:hypothetical protein n=1 Tax=Granulicella sp. dw_53 TaxID=2719792 RepID=UPI001BD659C8|nr:hypothetical protein [Granulicella sp. dw_53]